MKTNTHLTNKSKRIMIYFSSEGNWGTSKIKGNYFVDKITKFRCKTC